MTSESVSFDRVADRYDEHRGGLARGERMASALRAHLDPGPPVLEIGIGTGAVAHGMRALSSMLWAEPRERRVAELAPAAGFEVLDICDGEPFTWTEAPDEAIAGIESRPYSYLWDLPDDLWA